LTSSNLIDEAHSPAQLGQRFIMALSLQNANIVRQKAYNAAFSARGTTQGNGEPTAFYALKSLFLYLAANKGNPDLQFVAFSGTEVSSDGGNADKVIADAANKIYAFYARKRATATATWLKATDHATTASASDPTFMHEFNEASQSTFQLYGNGYAQSAGWTIRQDTDDITGATRTLAANSVDGFYIVGAP
jgi:hypothetical protein